MPKTVFIHIGAHKTGTTAIQAYFSRHRRHLLARGLLYPAAGIPSHYTGHHYLPRLFHPAKRRPPEAADSVRAMAREIRESPAEAVLISSEILENPRAPTAEVARALGLDRCRCVVVLYVRRQDDLFASAYASRIKQGRTIDSLREFVETQLRRRRGDFHALLTAWRRGVPGAEMQVVNYSDSKVARDSVGAMCEVLGIAAASRPEVTARANISIHPSYLPFLNLINRASADPQYRREAVIIPLNRLSSHAYASGIRHYIIDPDLRAKIVQSYAESNAMLGRDFLGGADPFAFDKEEFRDAVNVDPDAISVKALAAVFEQLARSGAASTDRDAEKSGGAVA
jgi:hypothetical protein